MDTQTIIAVGALVVTNIGLMVGLFSWIRTEASAERREMDNKYFTLLQAIHTEIKDFHGRLCTIEERNRK